MQRIDGQKDPIIKLLRELQYEEGRIRNSRFFAEGEELVKRAFDYGGAVEGVIVTDKFASSEEAESILQRAAHTRTNVYMASAGLVGKVLDAKPTPDCLAIVERIVASSESTMAGERPLVQMVEHGENADNLGMLLRSTDAAGVTGIVLTAQTTDPFSRRVVRGSRGAVFTLPICLEEDPAKAIDEARKRGLQVVATSAQSDTFYTEMDYRKPTLIVVGNEHVGISEVVRETADAVVRIPMRGKINSLNIAVAASIVLYEAVRQRG